MQPKPKTFIYLSLLVAFSVMNSCFAACDQVVCANVVKAQKICTDALVVKSDCGACHNITAKDFMDAEGNLSQTLVIDQPGRWCLCENINFNPSLDSGFQPAIQILSSDVHLDLGKNTLRQVNKDVLDIYGVLIGYGLLIEPDQAGIHFDNITITNGSINDFSGVGIYSYNPTYDFLEVPFSFNSLSFKDLNILDCGVSPSFNYFASGINLDSAGSEEFFNPEVVTTYNGVIIENCFVNRSEGSGGIQLFTVENAVVRSAQANNTFSYETPLTTVFGYAIYGRNIQMFDCQGNASQDLDFSNFGGQCGGLDLEESINIYLKDCQFNDSFGEADYIVNNNLSLNQNLVVVNCQFNNLRGGATASSVFGVHGSEGLPNVTNGQGIRFTNCQFNGAQLPQDNESTQGFSELGGMFYITLQNVVLDNCQACNIVTTNTQANVRGLLIGNQPYRDIDPRIGQSQNITFRNCVVSDISGAKSVIGITTPVSNYYEVSTQQGVQTNIVMDNCVVERLISTGINGDERVAGLSESLFFLDGELNEPFALFFNKMRNLSINNCRISDVRNLNSEQKVSSLSAGILVESVENPILINNSVSDCDRGILLTGTNEVIPNGFQLALTFTGAFATPPVVVPLNSQLKVFTTPAVPGSPFDAFYTTNGPRLSAPLTGQGEITNPANACSTVTNDLTGKIGVIVRDGACGSATFVANAQDANPNGIVILSYGVPANNYAGAPGQTVTAVAISQEDSDILVEALDSNPGLVLTIDTIPSSSLPQIYTNLTRGNLVQINSIDVNSLQDFIITSTVDADFTALGWQTGDEIFYDCDGGLPLADLVCSTTYYAVVYRPGYSEHGVIMNNIVDNCTVSGYQDNRELIDGTEVTNSAWVNNYAFNNGTPADELANYHINWSGTAPVYAGDLANYPTGSAKTYNISLIP